MSQIADFESTLKEVVQAKRLSASKITKLTELAMKLMKDDTQLVSILYRTHKSLSPSAKVSSLYVFDALARAAKSQTTKHNLVGDINSPEGNCATFLRKVQGVLEGLFQDMVQTGTPEAKEKAKKVLDIWVKGNTFPSTMLSQLGDVLKSKDKVKESTPKPVASSDPRVAAQAQPATSTPTPPPVTTTPPLVTSSHTPSLNAPQSALLALLTQAAANAGTSNQPSTSAAPSPNTPTAPLDIAQLALLQQLTQTAQMSNTSSYPNSVTTPVQSVHLPADNRFSYRDELPGGSRLPHTRFGSPDDEYHHDGPTRGGFRGGYRDRGRGRWSGNEGRGKRDGHDYFRDRERGAGAKRSRSRSPPSRYGARREIKPYSPPRRPMATAVGESLDTGESHQSVGDAEKDQQARFPSESSSDFVNPVQGTLDEHVFTAAPPAPPAAMASNAASTSSSSSPPPSSGPGTKQQPEPDNTTAVSPGLDQFNMANFNFTSPASWEELGQMWFASYGVMPTTEQLMQFVMFGGMDPSQNQLWSQQDSWDQSGEAGAGQWDNMGGNSYMGSQGMMGMGTGAGGMGHHGRNQFQATSTTNSNGDWNVGADPRVSRGGNTGQPAAEKRAGGGMRKVGDKWIFVREGDSVPSVS